VNPVVIGGVKATKPIYVIFFLVASLNIRELEKLGIVKKVWVKGDSLISSLDLYRN